MENQDKKRELIIEAALKRFAHFGLNKTTMNEIASDISFSKALLYYYFPDKLSLFAAVMDFIMAKIEAEVQEGLKKQASAYDAILFYLDKRQEFVRKYFNLLEFVVSTGPDLPPELSELFKRGRKAEENTVTSIIEQGNRAGAFKVTDPAEMSLILLDALAGMRFNYFTPTKSFYPEKMQFDQLLEKEKKLAVIFFKGLQNS